jgi:hypothetical protein
MHQQDRSGFYSNGPCPGLGQPGTSHPASRFTAPAFSSSAMRSSARRAGGSEEVRVGIAIDADAFDGPACLPCQPLLVEQRKDGHLPRVPRDAKAVGLKRLDLLARASAAATSVNGCRGR